VDTEGDPPPLTDHENGYDDDNRSVAHSESGFSSASRSNSIATSLSRNTATRTTLEERLRALETDELVAEVRESEVFCEPCKKWVRLSATTKYSLVNWKKHTERVHGRRR
jgi:DNA-binding HxlR family transcriptional regulator